jgi:hypothetical protein
MDNKQMHDWFKKLGEAWSERNPDKAADLFSKDVKYYESAFDAPCQNWNKVLELWQAVPTNQKDVSFSFELVAVADNLGVANWKVARTLLPTNQRQMLDGIFIIKLNDEHRCNYFKQWRAVK